MEYPTITIITSTFNCKNQLIHTIESIRCQKYKKIQWIIQDGGSTDGTIELVNNNRDVVSFFYSFKDKGIYDAWNRACKFISGDWVLFLGAGDIFFSNNSLKEFWTLALNNKRLSEYYLVYGIVKSVSQNDRYFRFSKKIDLSSWEFGRPSLPHHQGVFHRSICFSGVNTFDSSLRVAGDSKFVLQIINKYGKESVGFIPCRLSIMALDGISNKPQSVHLARKEISKILKDLSIHRPLKTRLFFLIKDYVTIIWYYIIPNRVKDLIRSR